MKICSISSWILVRVSSDTVSGCGVFSVIIYHLLCNSRSCMLMGFLCMLSNRSFYICCMIVLVFSFWFYPYFDVGFVADVYEVGEV